MKKKIIYSIFLICLILFGGIGLAACGEKPADPVDPPSITDPVDPPSTDPVDPPAVTPPVAKESIKVEGVNYVGINDNTSYKCVGFADGEEKTALVIPSTIEDVPVTEVADEAFASSGIQSLTIGKNIKHIGFKSFYNCDMLTSVVLGKDLETFGQEPFSHSNSIETLTVSENNATYYSANNALIRKSDNVLVIGTAGATTIPEGVTEIADRAYYGVFCSDKEFNLTIPASLTKIGQYAFYRPVAIKSINFAQDSKLTTIADYAFSGYVNEAIDTKLTTITFPKSLTQVGTEAFVNHKGLQSVTFTTPANSTLELGARAFTSSSSLTTLDLGLAQKTFANEVFRYCALSEVTLQNIVDPGKAVFRQSANLAKIIIKDGVERLGDQMFFQCSSLVTVDFTNVGNTFKTFGKEVFYSCTALKNTIQTETSNAFVFPQTTTTVDTSAFFNCDGITEIKLNRENLLTINDNAFAYCDGITSIWIPKSVTTVGKSLFAVSKNLIGVCTEASEIENVGENWNSGYNVKSEFSFEASKHTVASDELFSYELNKVGQDFEYTVSKLINTTATEIVFPDAINGFKVTTIPGKFLVSNKTIIKVIFGANIKSVGEQAFYNCDKITSITLNEGLQEIGKEAFIFCDGIAEITIPKTVKVIGTNIFQSTQIQVTITIYAYDENGELHNYPKTDGEHYDFSNRGVGGNYFTVKIIENTP